jgi:DNA-binding CsgD family transcriptional regulator
VDSNEMKFLQNRAWQSMLAELMLYITEEGNTGSLCFLDANQLLLDKLNYTKRDLEYMKCDAGKYIFGKDNYAKFIEIIKNLVSKGRRAKCGDFLKMKTKNGENLWIFWKFTVLEWYACDSPKIFLGWGIIDDEDMHAFKQGRKWLIEHNRERNKIKIDSLTVSELEVMPYISLDYTSEEIGNKLNITRHAIEKRIQRICVKLEVTGRLALAIFIRENGLD